MAKVRWGLLSTAHINHLLIPIIQNSPRGELVAVASRSEETAKIYATQRGIPLYFGSYEAMLKSGSIDVVYISLPNHLHAEWTIRAIQAGVQVLCEKPFALTLEEVDAVISTSQKYHKAAAEAFMYRHHPQTKIVGDMVHSGKLGEVLLFRGDFSFQIKPANGIRLVPEYGGGALWDIGVYPVSFAQYIFGSFPEWVCGTQAVGESGVDETFGGLMNYGNGKSALISCSFRSPYYNQAEIIGTQGRLVLTRPFNHYEAGRHLFFYPDQGDPYEVSVPEEELYSGEVEDMHDVILEGKKPYLTLDETRNHIKTTLALYESAQKGTMVRL
jgi:predicted dehydrogenase